MNGLDFDAMIVGLMAASFITFWLDTVDNVPKAASAILFSALLSGFAPSVIAAYLIGKFPDLAQTSSALTLFMAVLVGGSVTWGIPLLIIFARNKWGKSNA